MQQKLDDVHCQEEKTVANGFLLTINFRHTLQAEISLECQKIELSWMKEQKKSR